MNTILITGGNGFLGKNILNALLIQGKNIHIKIIARNLNCIDSISRPKNSGCSIETIKGDIQDKEFIKKSMIDVDTLIHLAALKDITYCENNPVEAVRTNIEGTINLLDRFEGETFLSLSSNKAVHPNSCYGATKLLMERIILKKAKENPDIRYIIVRSGNIIGSNGSVVDLWKHQINQNNRINITNLEMTRLFVDAHLLSEYIIQILKSGKSGTIYIPQHHSVKLDNLAKAVIELYGDNNTKINIVGMKQGEQVHEILSTDQEPVVNESQYNSSNNPDKMTLAEMKQLLLRI